MAVLVSKMCFNAMLGSEDENRRRDIGGRKQLERRKYRGSTLDVNSIGTKPSWLLPCWVPACLRLAAGARWSDGKRGEREVFFMGAHIC